MAAAPRLSTHGHMVTLIQAPALHIPPNEQEDATSAPGRTEPALRGRGRLLSVPDDRGRTQAVGLGPEA